MTNSINGMDGAQELLIKLVEQNPDDWTTRKKVVQVMYDAGFYRDASKMIWGAPEIPPAGEEVVFAARIVSKGQPTRAMRLFSTLIDNNMTQPAENLAMAKLLVKAGMPHQAIRFYGAATALDSGLADETFELNLVAVDGDSDSKNKSWSEFVSSEDFSWDGPDENAGQPVDRDEVSNTYAELLNGATQPVPMKAPAREKIERSRELPTWSIEKTTSSYIPKEILEPATEMSKPTLDPEPELAPTPKPEFVADVVPPVIVEAVSKPVSQSIAPTVYLAEVESTDEVMQDVPEDKKEEAFFKSYDEAHDHQSEVAAEKVSDGFDSVSIPTVMASTPTPSQAPEPIVSETVEIAEPNLPGKEVETPVETVVSESDDESLADYVAGVLSDIDDVKDEENQPSNLKKRVAGVFSSLVKKVRRQSDSTEADDRSDEENFTRISEGSENQPMTKESKVESLPVIDNISTIEAAPQPNVSAQPPQPKVEEPVANTPESAPQTNAPTCTGKLVPKPMEESSKPRELDGRTQLVALAPQNGSAYFTQLLERYNQRPDGELPKPAILARDMANVDYLGLIGKACGKDLDAFSKLLGLHRVMSSGDCREWVDDMNLLRKGYGDAVLATVVSKYSISECREILNSVYSSPAPQAAAV